MEPYQQLTIGLFGFGVAGEGLYKVLQQTPSLHAVIKKICIKNPDKVRNAPASLFTTDPDELLNDGDINVILEVIDDAAAAFVVVSAALRKGKDVVSASKKMIAENFPALLELQQQTGRSFLYESAACASIPVIRNLEEYYDNDLLWSMKAIVNGSTNFVLTRMFEDGLSFKQALVLAQQLGFAESNPVLDVEGVDAVHKWTFLLTHAFGIVEPCGQILFHGIQNIHAADAVAARSKNQVIKLVAHARKLDDHRVAAFVLPQFVPCDDQLAFVRDEYNGVVIESSFADKQFFYGKGAGSFPTASALLSDVAALRYHYKYGYRKLYAHTPHRLCTDVYLRVYAGFDHISQIPLDDFEWIEEWYSHESRKYIVGVIALTRLRGSVWWKEHNCSLILTPDPMVLDVDSMNLKQKSLQLAGLEAI